MRSLNSKLTLALLLVVAVSVGLTAYLANLAMTSEFRQYVSQGRLSFVEQVTAALADYYTDAHSWSGAQSLFESFPQFGDDRLILADSSGIIVGDTDATWLGESLTSTGLSNPISNVTAGGQVVGTLYLTSSAVGHGHGPKGGPSTPSEQPLTAAQQVFLSNVNTYLIIAAVAGAIVAVLLGILLSRHFTRPIRELARGADRIARGRLEYRVKAKSQDEFGKLAKSFNAMAASLEHAHESRKRLLADIAHELRTPLTVIDGTVDALVDGVFPADAANLRSIKEETALLVRLIADLRDLSLAESGRLKLDIQPVNTIELLQRVVSQNKVIARQKNIELSFDAPQQLPPLQVDPGRIEQVVNNLLSNALRHTPAGGSIVVTMAPYGASPGLSTAEILVSVADTGEGIPPEHLPHVFQRFYRPEDYMGRTPRGSGLGLSIAKYLVELHGGRIWAESEPGKGTTFYFTVPAVPRCTGAEYESLTR